MTHASVFVSQLCCFRTKVTGPCFPGSFLQLALRSLARRIEIWSAAPVGLTRTERVRLRAYEIYEQRGRQPGHDFDDWLAAEREFTTMRK